MKILADFIEWPIGENFGNRDHSTVMHAIDKIKILLTTDVETKKLISDLSVKINSEST